MDTKTLVRAGAISFVALAITVGIVESRLTPSPPDQPEPHRVTVSGQDPLQVELALCQSIGLAAASDQGCLFAWAENRRRFLGSDDASGTKRPIAGAADADFGSGAATGNITADAGGQAR